ncbi:dihydroorotase [Lachnospiraceae bacterium]|nr:dihydroorotase [Lachnospiraceae bacterium]
MIYIKSGRIVDSVSGYDGPGDVAIKGNTIIGAGPELDIELIKARFDISDSEIQIIDASGLVVAPGLVDTHVHFRDPGFTYKEDIETGANAAAKGGFTTVVCMANTKPAVDNLKTLEYIQAKAEAAPVHVLQTSTVTVGMQGKELVEMEQMADAGAAGFTDDGLPLMDEKILLKALEIAQDLDLPVSLHEEDPLFISQAGVNMGKISEQLGLGGAAAAAEDIMVARDTAIALHTGATLCIQHISSKNSVEYVRAAKKLGGDIHAEATPHHFTLTEEAVLKYGTNARMNPPLRTEEDRLAIIEGIKDGTIDMIVTDHAPHSKEEKEKPFSDAPSGIIGLETSLGLGILSLVKPGHITLLKLMELMSKNPAELYRMIPGSITEGAVADIVIFGEDEEWIADSFASKADNSPFKGWTLPGKIHYTICSGNIVYRS